jgi:methyl-accepting chemotaxis protein
MASTKKTRFEFSAKSNSRQSIRQRLFIQLIPMVIVGATVATFTWNNLKHGIAELADLSRLETLALETQIYISEMGSAVRAYMLDPNATDEVKRKQAADESNVATLKAIRELTHDQKTKSLIDEMSEFDDKNLNAAENKVMELMTAKQVDAARKVFLEEYQPMREKYNKMAKDLLSITRKDASEGSASISEDLKKSAVQIIFMLIAGIGATIVMFVISINRITNELREVAEALKDSEINVIDTSKQLAETSTSLSDGASEAASALEETSHSTQLMSTNAELAATGASSAAKVSQQSRGGAIRGQEAVTRMSQAIADIEVSTDSIDKQISNSNQRMADVANVIGGIAEKTKVINEIVFQTKLLSFNASVEAARAGEHGKGFAVVAEEIGNLAQMSGAAATEIAAMLTESQTKVDEMVDQSTKAMADLMAASRTKVEIGARISEECAIVLDEIVASSERSGLLADEAAKVVQSQSAGIQELSTAIHEIESAVTRAATSSRMSADFSVELENEARSLSSSVSRLNLLVVGEKNIN